MEAREKSPNGTVPLNEVEQQLFDRVREAKEIGIPVGSIGSNRALADRVIQMIESKKGGDAEYPQIIFFEDGSYKVSPDFYPDDTSSSE